jgi:hypothetical protein
MSRSFMLLIVLSACASTPHPFPLRAPLEVDPDRASFAPMPAPYTSSLAWDAVDNTLFARVSRALSVDVAAEAANANAMDEVARSSWFENRGAQSPDDVARGGCTADDLLPAADAVPDGAWTVDHGKDDGSSLGFRVDVPGKGKYLLKADTPEQPERSSAASVIGMAIYHAAGFNTTCEQIVYVRASQLRLKPGLTVTNNAGFTHAFDAKALAHVLDSSTHRGALVRMSASKWLPGVPLGPFRYEGTRDDDPNDVVPHEHRRELRGSRVLAAWLDHYDAREQNSLDVWVADDPKHAKTSRGYVRHYILDTSDVIGGDWDPDAMTSHLGYAYYLDFAEVATDLVSFGAIERPWDRDAKASGHEKFGYFLIEDFDPEAWKSGYPNPAFLNMTERSSRPRSSRTRVTPSTSRACCSRGSTRSSRAT